MPSCAVAPGRRRRHFAINEVRVPMTVAGPIHTLPSDTICPTRTLANSGGGSAELRLSIDVARDTDGPPLTFSVLTNQVLQCSYHPGGQWVFGSLGSNSGLLDDGPGPIDFELTAPLGLPIVLRTEDHGGGEIRVKVKLTCYADAEHRHAEAEIGPMSAGCGVTIHERCCTSPVSRADGVI